MGAFGLIAVQVRHRLFGDFCVSPESCCWRHGSRPYLVRGAPERNRPDPKSEGGRRLGNCSTGLVGKRIDERVTSAPLPRLADAHHGQARTKDRVPVEGSTVCRETVDQLRRAGDWSVHRERLTDRHNKSRRGPKKGRSSTGTWGTLCPRESDLANLWEMQYRRRIHVAICTRGHIAGEWEAIASSTTRMSEYIIAAITTAADRNRSFPSAAQ